MSKTPAERALERPEKDAFEKLVDELRAKNNNSLLRNASDDEVKPDSLNVVVAALERYVTRIERCLDWLTSIDNRKLEVVFENELNFLRSVKPDTRVLDYEFYLEQLQFQTILDGGLLVAPGSVVCQDDVTRSNIRIHLLRFALRDGLDSTVNSLLKFRKDLVTERDEYRKELISVDSHSYPEFTGSDPNSPMPEKVIIYM